MATMRAARVTEFKKPYTIESIDIPKPKPNQLLVKTGAAGFCDTGISFALVLRLVIDKERLDDQGWRFPFTFANNRKS